MEVLLLLIGFVCLIKGADLFVEGSSSLAKFLKVPSVIIGLTIVAMGTSAPEASVSIQSALSGSNAIALSNIIGSNLFNGMVVVGVCAFLSSFKTDETILKRDLPLNCLISFVLLMMMLDGKLSRYEGLVLVVLMILYLGLMIYSALKNQQEETIESYSLSKSILFILIGLFLVILGGQQVVDQACLIATKLGVSENFIGLTIVAIGTSLPELVTSIVATKKGDSGLALGNAVGSNLFNILFILGFSSFISPLTVLNESIMDGMILFASSLFLYGFAKSKGSMDKREGALCILFYLLYTFYLLQR